MEGEITCKDGAPPISLSYHEGKLSSCAAGPWRISLTRPSRKKWKALAEILGLEEIEGLRQDLQRAHNDLRKDAKRRRDGIQGVARVLVSQQRSQQKILSLPSSRACEQRRGISGPSSPQDVADETWYASGASNGNPSDRATGVQGLNTALKSLPGSGHSTCQLSRSGTDCSLLLRRRT